MTARLITPWRANCEHLRTYDAVGSDFRVQPPCSHYPGNFWMARTSFIKTLPDFGHYYARASVHRRVPDPKWHRLPCEFWIGSGIATPNVFSLVADRTVDDPRVDETIA